MTIAMLGMSSGLYIHLSSPLQIEAGLGVHKTKTEPDWPVALQQFFIGNEAPYFNIFFSNQQPGTCYQFPEVAFSGALLEEARWVTILQQHGLNTAECNCQSTYDLAIHVQNWGTSNWVPYAQIPVFLSFPFLIVAWSNLPLWMI